MTHKCNGSLQIIGEVIDMSCGFRMDKTGRDYVRSKMPMIGLGTYQVRDKAKIFTMIDTGLGAGYRFIDTAQVYGNEAYIGEALEVLLPKYGLKREDVVITTKISPANQGAKTSPSLEKSLTQLNTEYVDIVIIHWPGTSRLDVKDKQNAMLRRETWEVLEEYHRNGKVRAIGVSNYEISHLKELLQYSKVVPCLNQVEYHPFFHQTDLVEFCSQHDIHFQAYSSFGGPDMKDDLFKDNLVQKMADKYNLTVPVFLLAWAMSQNISVLPRSTTALHITENFNASKTKLTWDDTQEILNNGKHRKACWDPSTVA